MHIAEGMLSYKWSGFWWAVVSPFLFIGLYHINKIKRFKPLYLPLLSTTAAAVFIFSMIPLPVPFTGTTSHPVATGLASLLLGFFATVVISFISLLIQAVFLGHGGLTTLGADIFSMGVVGAGVALWIFYFFKKIKLPLGSRVFLSAFFADIAVYIVTAGQLAMSLSGSFIKFILLILPIQLPIAILEGLITAGIIKYIYIHKRDIVGHLL